MKPEQTHYLQGWGRPGHTAVLAVDLDRGASSEAVWYRRMTSEESGYGFVDDQTPEVALAVVPDHRGHGAGGALRRALRDAPRSQGYGALGLSVEKGNPALGIFLEAEDARTMRADLFAGWA